MSIDLLLAAAQHLEQQSRKKRDEDRDEVTLDPAAAAAAAAAASAARHQTVPLQQSHQPPAAASVAVSAASGSAHHAAAAAAPAPAPARPAARSPSYIATHHSYVRAPAPAPAPAAAPSSHGAPLYHQRPPVAPEPARNGALAAGAAAGAGTAAATSPSGYRSEVSDGGDERRGRVSAGTREVHNKLEKNRRAHLKECFEMLRRQVPVLDDKRTSNLGILRGALRYIGALKRKERECEHEMERLAREKIANQQRLAQLKRDLSAKWDHIDFGALLPEPAVVSAGAVAAAAANDDSNSTLSASERFEDNSYQASPEPPEARPGEPAGSPERRRRVSETRAAAASPAYLAGHSSGYSSSSPTVAGEAGLAGLAAMASSQEKLLVAGRQVALVPTPPGAEPHLLRTEHGVYVPVTALGTEPGRPPASVSYVGAPGEPLRKAIVLETVPTHIVPAQRVQPAGAVRLAGAAGLQLGPSSLQVLTPAGVRLLSAPPAHSAGAGGVTGTGAAPRTVLSLPRSSAGQPRPTGHHHHHHHQHQPPQQQQQQQQQPPVTETPPSARLPASGLVSQVVSPAPLPRLVTQSVAHLMSPSSSGPVTVLAPNKVVQQLPVVTSYMASGAQQVGKAVVVVTAAGLVSASKN